MFIFKRNEWEIRKWNLWLFCPQTKTLKNQEILWVTLLKGHAQNAKNCSTITTTHCTERIAFESPRKSYRTGSLFTHTNGCGGAIFVTEWTAPRRSPKWSHGFSARHEKLCVIVRRQPKTLITFSVYIQAPCKAVTWHILNLSSFEWSFQEGRENFKG